MENFIAKYQKIFIEIIKLLVAVIIGGTIFYVTIQGSITQNKDNIEANRIVSQENREIINVVKDWTEEMRFNVKKQMKASGLEYETIDKIKIDRSNK